MTGAPADAGKMERFVEWFLQRFVGRIPTTQAVCFVGIAAFVATILLWLFLAFMHSIFEDHVAEWVPQMEMLGFISLWGGLSAAQFGMKRATDIDLAAAKKGGGGTTTVTTPGPSRVEVEGSP